MPITRSNWEPGLTIEEKAYAQMGLDPTLAMKSSYYENRFRIEYLFIEASYRKLDKMIKDYEAGTLDYEPKCNIRMLKEQRDLMGKLLGVLELRAEIEGIALY